MVVVVVVDDDDDGGIIVVPRWLSDNIGVALFRGVPAVPRRSSEVVVARQRRIRRAEGASPAAGGDNEAR